MKFILKMQNYYQKFCQLISKNSIQINIMQIRVNVQRTHKLDLSEYHLKNSLPCISFLELLKVYENSSNSHMVPLVH